MLLPCVNTNCMFCKYDHQGELKCTTEPFFLKNMGTLMGCYIICGAFAERKSETIEELYPRRDSNGNYPGMVGYKKSCSIEEEDDECKD